MSNASQWCRPTIGLGLVVFGALAACAGGSGRNDNSESTGKTSASIIGGVADTSAQLDAVGALGDYTQYGSNPPVVTWIYCTATLIAPDAILTAKHCLDRTIQNPMGFVIGWDGFNAKRIVPIVATEWETSITGGAVAMGSDVAVAHLAYKVTDIAPLPYRPFDRADVGRRFAAVGYGVKNQYGEFGERQAATYTARAVEGNFFDVMLGGFEALKSQAGDLFGDPGYWSTQYGLADLKSLYESSVLLPGGYEVIVGSVYGDAQLCSGDSGGPLLQQTAQGLTVFGVTSWGLATQRNRCDLGGVYATFGPATMTFLHNALQWEDPCWNVSIDGYCDGSVAVRCTDFPAEGPRRVTRTDCNILGQLCGPDVDGRVSCTSTRPYGDGGTQTGGTQRGGVPQATSPRPVNTTSYDGGARPALEPI